MSNVLDKETVAGLSIEEILDVQIDQIAEVTPFQPKPTACYGFTVKSISLEEVGESNAIQVIVTINEVVAMDDDSDEAREMVGELPAEYKENFFVGGDSDFGLKAFRTMFSDLVGEGDSATIRELMERGVGASGSGLLKLRKWKNKNTGEMQEGNQWEPTAIDLS